MQRHSNLLNALWLAAGSIVTVSLAACGIAPASPSVFHDFGPPGFSSSSDFGATQGGVQDMGLARELIAGGRVPPADAFVVEGMFSEHDLGLSGKPCVRTLCLRGALGIAPALDQEPKGWMQIALSSNIDMERFERPGLTLVACVDVSGSMGWEYVTASSEFPTPGEVSRNLLSAIAKELGPQDRLAMVTYGTTVNTVLPFTSGGDQATIQAAIDRLSTDGSTNMEGGVRRAYELARDADSETDQVRVMLFTDIQPNVGATSATEFEQMVTAGAEDGIGLTVMAVGVGLRQEVMNAISHTWGGNAFSLFDNEDVTELMEDHWPWLVSPIAYNLSVVLTPSPGFIGAEAYGFPSGTGDDEGPRLEASTIFLSRRRGALLVSFVPQEATDLSELSVAGRLSYETPQGELVEEEMEVVHEGQPLDERGQYFEQSGVGKTVALAVLVSSMASAAELYGSDRDSAVGVMQAALDRFAADTEALQEPAFEPEVELARDLLQLMREGAEQGDLYGSGYDMP